jgi:hypothetical protein
LLLLFFAPDCGVLLDGTEVEQMVGRDGGCFPNFIVSRTPCIYVPEAGQKNGMHYGRSLGDLGGRSEYRWNYFLSGAAPKK